MSHVSFATEYRSGEDHIGQDFFGPALRASRFYDRAVGYFRSSVFLVTGEAFLGFVRSGGKVRFVCSPELTREDLQALAAGHAQREQILARRLEDSVEQLLGDLGLESPTMFLATLVATGVLEIRVAVREGGLGIYHEKIGIFTDGEGRSVSFKGSANETWQGLHEQGNLESIEVFCSWANPSDAARVVRHREYFGALWADEVPGVRVVTFPDAARQRLCRVAKPSLEEAIGEMERKGTEGAPASARKPLPHQAATLRDWRRKGRRGLVRHATGSGKTFTALLAVREHTSKGQPALILVPSKLLLSQWAGEVTSVIPAANLLLAGGGNTRWRKLGRLEAHSRDHGDLGPRVIIATMRTAASDGFRHRLHDGDHLLLVVDEVHQWGSPHQSRGMSIRAGSRLGLSATPERYGDPEGTQRVMGYFQNPLDPQVTLADAIDAGRLVPYTYTPHAVTLTDPENASWSQLTDTIRREMARSKYADDGPIVLSDRVKLLLIQRARIAKKAQRKVQVAADVLARHFEEGQRWLVYCEDIDHLQEVRRSLRAEGIPSMEYFSGMPGDAHGTLAWLRRFGGIVVSIRCLDEGVDIPEVSHALVLASSQNPRQFIQRRGRVLRRAPGKHVAHIHDALVVPPLDGTGGDQLTLAGTEIRRAMEFAEGALNRDSAATVREIAVTYGIDFDAPPQIYEDAEDESPDDVEHSDVPEYEENTR